MASFRPIYFILLFITVLATLSYALYEDQVGKFDWKRSFIGKVKQARLDEKRLFVITKDNVIAALSLETGQILWRQLLGDLPEHQLQLLYLDKELVAVSGSREVFQVYGWKHQSGVLLWNWVQLLEGKSDPIYAIKGTCLAVLVPVEGSHLEITQYNVKTGAVSEKARRIEAPWLGRRCVMANSYFVCIAHVELFWLDVFARDSHFNRQEVDAVWGGAEPGNVNLLEFTATVPSFLLVKNSVAKVVQIQADRLQHRSNVSPNAISIGNIIYQVEANFDNPDKRIKIKTIDFETGIEGMSAEVDYPLGLGGPYLVSGSNTGDIRHLLLSRTDNALTLVSMPEGKVSWTREEALSGIVSVEFFELPASDLDVSIENEFTTNSNDVVSMLLHRISTQSTQLYNLFIGGQLSSNNALVRDDFGLHKIIVVATKVGKLFGIDTLTGSIVWSYRLPNVKAFNDINMVMLVQRTARYAPLPAQCVLLAEDASGLGIIFQFDPITGSSVHGVERLDYRIKQAIVLPHEDDNHVKPVLVIDEDNIGHLHPESVRAKVAENIKSTFVYLIESSALKGFKLGAKLSLEQVWEVNLGTAQLVGVSTRPMAERVHSQGRVLPDRSVYYKYVNPNLIAVASINDDVVHKHVLSVYLIDGVTGFVLYSVSHKKCKGPVHIVHSENWLVYTYFNERFRRNEIVAAELYEGDIQSNSTAFSSFAVSHIPEVQIQSYILPATPVSMTATLTERGITSKFLLVGLSSGGVLEIPWLLLQPRFANIPCGPEESCIPYMPEILLHPESIINYNQSLAAIKGIEVVPARLESTSHVLVYGLDLFYTRIAPSKTFDVLKEDFDYKLIILVLVGLVVASYVTKYLASKKALRQAWK